MCFIYLYYFLSVLTTKTYLFLMYKGSKFGVWGDKNYNFFYT